MENVHLASAHWFFLLVIFMIFRRDIVLPSIIGIFGLGLFAGKGNGFLDMVINGMQVVFQALLHSAVELFDIMLVIALMVAMLRSLQKSGADLLMVGQVKKLMVNGSFLCFRGHNVYRCYVFLAYTRGSAGRYSVDTDRYSSWLAGNGGSSTS